MCCLDRAHGYIRCRKICGCGREGGVWRWRNFDKNEVIQRLSAVMGCFINLRKRGKPGEKASITVRDGCRPVYGDIR